MLRVDHLRAGALPELSFQVPGGECLAVEGPSGAGKSRLLRAIADLDPAPGYIALDGIERSEMTAVAWRRQVRYVAAEPGWWAATPRLHLGSRVMARAERLAATLGLDAALLDRRIAELSTGERLRLALVRALADEPSVVLLDEPTASLDTEAAALVDEQIRFLTLSGRSVILVSHDAAQIERLAHARLILPGARGPAGAAKAMPQTAESS